MKQYIKNIFTIFMSALIVFSSSNMVVVQADGPLNGLGTAENPYLIKTAQDLVSMSSLVKTEAGYASAHYRLEADLDMKDINFEPIGQGKKFAGIFDGNGYEISNLSIQKPGVENVGLFDVVEHGTIKNLGIKSGMIIGGAKTGAMIGRSNYATIINCFSKADVKGTNDVGGLVGMFNNSTMENCYVWGSIEGSGVTVGGLVGGANRSPNPEVQPILKNCYSLANVKGSQFVGSAIGYDESTAGEAYAVLYSNIYYDGSKIGVGNNDKRFGMIPVDIEDFSNGKLLEKLNTGTEGYSSWVIGALDYPEFNEGISTIGIAGEGTKEVPYRIRKPEDLVAMSTAIHSDANNADAYYVVANDLDMKNIDFKPIGQIHSFKGVLDGQNYTISNLKIKQDSTANVGLFGLVEGGTVKNIGIESGSIEGANQVGGLVGRTMYATILNCYSKADVKGAYNVGGVVGMFNNSILENCFVRGNIMGTAESAGGLIGGANRSIDSNTPTIIKNSYSSANVEGVNYVGSLIGYDESTVGMQYEVTMENLYYDKTKTGIGNNNGRIGITGMVLEDFTNGNLLEELNSHLEDGYSSWLQDNTGFPAFHGKSFIRTSLTGEGTMQSPYLIKTVADLLEMERVVNVSLEFAGGYYKLTNNLDLDGENFNGIASQTTFTGVFDGSGHIVSNINIHILNGRNVGFFHTTNGAKIMNFGIDSGTIRAGYQVGSFVGKANQTTIINSYNNALVRGFEEVGGFIGTMMNSEILNSYNSGTVRAPLSIGGLVGKITSTDPQRKSAIKNSYNIGNVHWGTYSGRIAANVEDGENLAIYENVYYNKENVPNMAIGNFVEVDSIVGKKKAELKNQEFVNTLNSIENDNYSEWELGANGFVRLKLFGDVSELEVFMQAIKNQPSIKNGKVQLPKSESGRYEAKLAGSTNQQVVALDGTVYSPLNNQKVELIYDIIDTQKNKEVVARLDRNITLDVAGSFDNDGKNSKPEVIPGLREWYGLEGNYKVTENTKIVVENAEGMPAAEKLKMYLEEITGKSISIKTTGASDGDIIICYAPDKKAELGGEGYYLNVGDKVVIEAPTTKGMLYGGVSIAQIIANDASHSTIPKGVVRDYPQDSVRGGMIDVARKYFEIDYIEEMGKYMAWFKMNTFHLHINEDSGLGGEYSSSFVVESKKYPVLNTYNTGYIWSQDEYRQMQKDLKEYGVDVITEIDTPGHATIFQLIDPSIVSGANFDLTNHYDESLSLVSSVFDEFLDGPDPVFQNAVVHIGTDESANTNENMRKYIHDLSQYCLSKDNIDEVYFWGNLSIYYGETSIDSSQLVNQVWDSADQRIQEALDDGFKIVNSTSNSLYLIPGNANGLHNGFVDMATFYDTWEGSSDFNTHRTTNPTWIANRNYHAEYNILKGNPQIIGTLFCNWNDRSWANDFDILDLVIPYIGVISEKTWYGDTNRFESGKEFVALFNTIGKTAPSANPRRYIETDSTIIAEYDFENVKDNKIPDQVNSYDATFTNGSLVTPENYGNGKVLELKPETMLSLPFNGVGYPYTAAFDLYLLQEQGENAILFQDGNCTFYLDYEGKGVGFKIGKYAYIFEVDIPREEWVKVALTSNYIHGSSATTLLKINDAFFTPTMIEHPSSVGSHSMSSYLGTSKMFSGLDGYVDNLKIGNKYNQNFNYDQDYEFVGEGTEESPYRIQNPDDLEMFSYHVNASDKASSYFRLESDINMQGKYYTPAGEFSGVLDGNGFVISNLTINQKNSTNVGLIGYLNGGTIKNLGLDNATITGDSKVGTLVGRTMYSTITNCFAKANVKGSGDVGVLVGMFNNSEMSNCYAWGTAEGSIESVGGLVGASCRSIDLSTPSSIDNCYSMVEVTAQQHKGTLIGYDESAAGEQYYIKYTNLYYDSSKTSVGNNPTVEGVIPVNIADFTNGTLIERLNTNLKEDYSTWVKGVDNYPEHRRDTDKRELKEWIDKAKAINTEEYTKESVDKLIIELEKALVVYKDNYATQEQINKVCDILKTVYDNMERKPVVVDTTVLKALLENAKAMDVNLYTEDSVQALKKVITETEEMLKPGSKPTQNQVDDMVSKLKSVLEKLELKVVSILDTAKLKDLIEQVEKIDTNKYNKASVEKLLAALSRAKEVLNTATTQAQIDTAYDTLLDALDGLKGKESGSVEEVKPNSKPSKTGDITVIIPYVGSFLLAGISYYMMKKKKEMK